MYYQNDPKWKHNKLNNSAMTIGAKGCLVTALGNASRFEKKRPCLMSDLLRFENGFTKDNLVIWAVASKILNAKIDHDYKGEIEYSINTIYIVNFLNGNNGHFTNLISKQGDNYNIFDVWDGKYKTISKPRRLVKIDYK